MLAAQKLALPSDLLLRCEVLRSHPWTCMPSLATSAFISGMHQLNCKVWVASFFFIEKAEPYHVISSSDIYHHQKIPVAFCTFLPSYICCWCLMAATFIPSMELIHSFQLSALVQATTIFCLVHCHRTLR